MTNWQMYAVLVAAITTAFGFGYFLHGARAPIRERQRELRKQFRDVLHDLSNQFNSYHWSGEADPLVLQQASGKLEIIRNEGLVSPSDRHIEYLHTVVNGLALSFRDDKQLNEMLGKLLIEQEDPTEVIVRMRAGQRQAFEELATMVKEYRRATTKMDNGSKLIYFRYRFIPPYLQWKFWQNWQNWQNWRDWRDWRDWRE
ncbi:hypothetical protein [Mycolicibacterium hippocampi]|uniref:Uncharacterized protein n=1 Tax=Mycolicibacterium hippocampi TaxID=659824 RepID=A0A7I9ZQT5_9MYCO|nr:hypothetical protein [Mycolicibacterium hippocampi]GFH03143.1 hypothetical protein MHIP_36260 [Mycolicibacterium hippocampi]